MTWAELRFRARSSVPGHEFMYALRVLGLRDRFRCPSCRAVGTWKPHGGVLDGLVDRIHGEVNKRLVRRWLCKYCGHYEGPEGTLQAWPDLDRGWWVLPQPHDPQSSRTPGDTPQDAVAQSLGTTWPWRG